MGDAWPADLPGVLTLPSGRRVLGRGLGTPSPVPPPELGVYLLGRPPPAVAWDQHWVRWRDFGLPRDPAELRTALAAAWERAAGERVEIVCGGGTGRTGTALACLAVLDGVPAEEAVAFVRRHYRPRAVETRRQRRLVSRLVAG
ncbi:protein-tyrosine phosphatase family protein [Blastococcus sp. SYSU DS0617]